MSEQTYASIPVSTAYADNVERGVPAVVAELDVVISGLLAAITELEVANLDLFEGIRPILREEDPALVTAVHSLTPQVGVTCRLADEISNRSARLIEATGTLRRMSERVRDVRSLVQV